MNDNGTECIAKCFDSGDRKDGTNIVRYVAKTMDRQKSGEEKRREEIKKKCNIHHLAETLAIQMRNEGVVDCRFFPLRSTFCFDFSCVSEGISRHWVSDRGEK